MFVARRSEPRRTPASIARFPARWGKLFPREGLMLGTASRPPQPATGAALHPSFTTPRCRAGSAVRARPRALGGPGTRPDRADGSGGLFCAASRRLSPPAAPTPGGAEPRHAGILFPSRPPPPAKLILPSRAGSPRQPPPTAPGGCRSLTWRLPGRSLTASGGGARRSRDCLCRHLHSPLPR